MREVIQLSIPQEPALFRTNLWLGPEVKETPYWNFKMWLLEDEDDEVQAAMTRSLNRARKNYEEYLAQDVQGDFDDEVQGEGGVGELHHPNQFGRGQHISSVGTGWKPKPIQWKLLGGAGGKPMKKIGPKAKESGGGKLHFITIS